MDKDTSLTSIVHSWSQNVRFCKDCLLNFLEPVCTLQMWVCISNTTVSPTHPLSLSITKLFHRTTLWNRCTDHLQSCPFQKPQTKPFMSCTDVSFQIWNFKNARDRLMRRTGDKNNFTISRPKINSNYESMSKSLNKTVKSCLSTSEGIIKLKINSRIKNI